MRHPSYDDDWNLACIHIIIGHDDVTEFNFLPTNITAIPQMTKDEEYNNFYQACMRIIRVFYLRLYHSFLRLALISIIIFFGTQNLFTQITNTLFWYVLQDHTMLLLFPFPVMTFPSHKYTTSNYSHAKMTWYFKNANHHETWWLFLLLKILLNIFQRLHDNTIKYM